MPSSLHRHTPSLTVVDPRGLAVRSVTYCRTSAQSPAEERVNCQNFSAAGLLLEQWDSRLNDLRSVEPQTAPNQKYVYSLSGQPVSTQSVDAGGRWFLTGAAGQTFMCWDTRETLQRYEYDQMLRRVAVFERALHGTDERCTERLAYAGNTTQDQAENRCARLIRHDDPAGTLHIHHYALSGQALCEQRFFLESPTLPHWPPSVAERDRLLSQPGYTTCWQYDAVGAVIAQTDAKNNHQHTRYGVDGLLFESALTLHDGEHQVLVDRRVYNASIQVESEHLGNGVVTTTRYSSLDGRLERVETYRAGKRSMPLQDLSYTYDGVGNVMKVSDLAQPVQWSSNTRIDPISTYQYDSLYQLISATGRENVSNSPGPGLPGLVTFGSADDSVWRNYTQSYTYDEGGNLTVLTHQVSVGRGYTRVLAVAKGSNHAVLHDAGRPAPPTPGLGSGFDLNGNQHMLLPGQTLQWNIANRLSGVTLVSRETGANDEEIYAYDGTGQRVRKRRTTHASGSAHTMETLYLPGLEVRHNTATGERLNVIAAQGGRGEVRVLQWESGRPSEIPDKQMRFNLSDHLGSSTLELNSQAELLTQESYYPYGATAWWAAKNAVQAQHKTLRYSGKELDASGLYYYGFRYYAPWIQRWISADPAGDIDGLNLYAMVRNNPITFKDSMGLNGNDPNTPTTERVLSLDKYLRENHPVIYPGTLSIHYAWDLGSENPVHDEVVNAALAAGYSHKEIERYNDSVTISAPLPGNIFSGLENAYIASSSYFNETARAITNPAIHEDPGAWTGANLEHTFERMHNSESGYVPLGHEASGMSAALRIDRKEAVSLFDISLRQYPGGQATTYRGYQVSDSGLKALHSHASQGDLVRTEQFLSVSDLRGVAKSFAEGQFDTRTDPLNAVMLTVIGSSAKILYSPVNEAERVYPLEATFKVEHAGLSSLGIRAYVPSATHFVLRETSVSPQKRSHLPFLTDPGGRR